MTIRKLVNGRAIITARSAIVRPPYQSRHRVDHKSLITKSHVAKGHGKTIGILASLGISYVDVASCALQKTSWKRLVDRTMLHVYHQRVSNKGCTVGPAVVQPDVCHITTGTDHELIFGAFLIVKEPLHVDARPDIVIRHSPVAAHKLCPLVSVHLLRDVGIVIQVVIA